MQKPTGGIPIATELTMVSRSLRINGGDEIRTDGPDNGPVLSLSFSRISKIWGQKFPNRH